MSSLLHIGAVALGGACGSLARYWLTNLPVSLPGKYCLTAVVNLSGCLIIGIMFALLGRLDVHPAWRDFLMVGCLGGYTTYSTFSLDAMQLMQQGRWQVALAYLAITIAGGLIACAIGWFGTERLLRCF